MKTQELFTFFCSVQHRLAVSPQAAALFFFILGELSASGFATDSIAMANPRICGTIHISNAALRKCRDELIAAGIITFDSSDNGKTLALYTLCPTGNWILDAVRPASSSASGSRLSDEKSDGSEKHENPIKAGLTVEIENPERSATAVDPKHTAIKHQRHLHEEKPSSRVRGVPDRPRTQSSVRSLKLSGSNSSSEKVSEP